MAAGSHCAGTHPETFDTDLRRSNERACNPTQAIVTESLKHLKATRILVAHRLSTLRHADRIYLLEKGRIVQQGTFRELASAEGMFAVW